MKSTDLRMLFGFLLLVLLTALAAAIALGHVEEKSSFGLQFLLGSLSSLAGGFGQWAFGNPRPEKPLDNGSPKEPSSQ